MLTRRLWTVGRGGPAALLAVALVACSSGTAVDDSLNGDLDGVVFLTLSEVQDATMQALFEGDVELDDAGCLRLDDPDAHTVIWPHGFRTVPTVEGIEVQDEHGEFVGWVGFRFTLPGGEVPALHDGIPMTAADRERARTTCPGRYWIVGAMP